MNQTNMMLRALCIGAVSLGAISAWAQTAPATTTTTTTTTTAPATPAAAVAPGAPAAAAPAAPAAAPTSPVSTPSMAGPLTVNLKPENFDIPGFGKIYVSGAVTGLALAEDTLIPGDRHELADVSNAQVFIQKVDGEFQFFIQAGAYSLPALGAGYLTAGNATTDFYGPMPQAFIKIAPNANFSIQAGKLPTLIGAEYTFTYENMNIERGLLWNQETAVSQGVQANYTAGPVVLNASWTDGYYSQRFNWLAGAATWTINPANTLELVISGNLGTTDYSKSLATPIFQNNNEQLDNLMYTFTSGAWVVEPYLQYTQLKANAAIGVGHDTTTFGEAILVNYAVPNTSYNVSGRVEYISSSGSATDGSANLLYGPGSSAWSGTLTATYQSGVLFTRAEVSYVDASNTTSGFAFGLTGKSTSQTRFAIEAGILF
jgi:hypothetical protein